jgi:hypothetical protein
MYPHGTKCWVSHVGYHESTTSNPKIAKARWPNFWNRSLSCGSGWTNPTLCRSWSTYGSGAFFFHCLIFNLFVECISSSHSGGTPTLRTYLVLPLKYKKLHTIRRIFCKAITSYWRTLKFTWMWLILPSWYILVCQAKLVRGGEQPHWLHPQFFSGDLDIRCKYAYDNLYICLSLWTWCFSFTYTPWWFCSEAFASLLRSIEIDARGVVNLLTVFAHVVAIPYRLPWYRICTVRWSVVVFLWHCVRSNVQVYQNTFGVGTNNAIC